MGGGFVSCRRVHISSALMAADCFMKQGILAFLGVWRTPPPTRSENFGVQCKSQSERIISDMS